MTLKNKYTQDGYSGANQFGPYGSGGGSSKETKGRGALLGTHTAELRLRGYKKTEPISEPP